MPKIHKAYEVATIADERPAFFHPLKRFAHRLERGGQIDNFYNQLNHLAVLHWSGSSHRADRR
jgi:hypothetical protein